MPEVTDPRLADPLREGADRLEKVLNDYRTGQDRIARDRNTTDSGKTAALRRLQDAIRGAIEEAMAEPLGELRKRRGWGEELVSERRNMILPGQGPMERVEAQEREVRDLARAMKPHEVVDKYMKCCRNADTIAVRALENAPPSFPLLTPDQIAEGAELHAQARFPEEYENLLQARAAVDHTEWNVHRALAELNPPAPSPRELAQAASEAAG